MVAEYRSSNNFIYLAVAAVNLITFTAGAGFSWPSPVLPKLNSTDPSINPLPRPTTTFEQSWIAAFMNLGAVFGPLAGGPSSEKFGKKKSLLLMGSPMVISHLLCAFATNVYFFMFARFLIGIGVGAAFGVVPGYVGDIAENKNRGLLGCALLVYSCTGILFIYIIGPFVSIRTFSLINVIPMVLFYVLYGYFIPESPYDLIKQGKRKAAEESLMKLRNKTYEQIQNEFALIIVTMETSGKLKDSKFYTIFTNKALTKAFLISNCIMFFQQLSGICAILGYMQSIFESAGDFIPSVYSVMLVGVIQLISSIVSAQLADRAGRKILLLISYIFCIGSHISLGAYFYLEASGGNADKISWLPIASLIIFMIAFNLGLNNLPWVLLAEFFPANIRAFSSTIASSFTFFLSFIVTMCFPYLNVAVGLAGSFWIFAAVLIAGFIFTVIFVPETKGKSSQEIQNVLEGIHK